MPITKIISGGQTGADQAGLRAARELGLQTGGYMPNGYKTEAGPWHEARDFGMDMTSSAGYSDRTMFNIEYADATLIFGNQYTPGCIQTRHFCLRKLKPLWQVPWSPRCQVIFDWRAMAEWLDFHKVTTLNIAGNRESINPGVGEACKAFVTALIREYNQ